MQKGYVNSNCSQAEQRVQEQPADEKMLMYGDETCNFSSIAALLSWIFAYCFAVNLCFSSTKIFNCCWLYFLWYGLILSLQLLCAIRKSGRLPEEQNLTNT